MVDILMKSTIFKVMNFELNKISVMATIFHRASIMPMNIMQFKGIS